MHILVCIWQIINVLSYISSFNFRDKPAHFDIQKRQFQVFNIRYLEMHKVQGAKCAISKLMYGPSVCTDDNDSLKLVAYRLVHAEEPYINLHLTYL